MRARASRCSDKNEQNKAPNKLFFLKKKMLWQKIFDREMIAFYRRWCDIVKIDASDQIIFFHLQLRHQISLHVCHYPIERRIILNFTKHFNKF